MQKFEKFLDLIRDALDHIELKVLSIEVDLFLSFALLNLLGSWFGFILAKINHLNEDALATFENLF